MPAATYDFEIEQGTTFEKTFRWKDVNEDPVNLTGAEIRMQIRRSVNSDDVLLELSTTNGRIISGGATGDITLRLVESVSAAIEWRRGVYDLEVEASDGTVTRLLQGAITISREVTR